MNMDTKFLLPTTNDDPQSIPNLKSLSEDEMRWLQANEVLLESGRTPIAESIEAGEPAFGVNASNATTCVAKNTTSTELKNPLTFSTLEHHYPQTQPTPNASTASLHRKEDIQNEDATSYFEQATTAMGAVAGLLTPSADPHLRSSYKALPAKSLPSSLSHRPSRPKLHALRVQSATLHSSHIPAPRRRLQSASPKTWHKNRHYHLDGDEQDIDTAPQSANEETENQELPDVFSTSSPSWLAEPSLNAPEATFHTPASTPEMLSLIPCASNPSTISLNLLPSPSRTPSTPTKSTSARPQVTRSPPSLGSGERKEWIYRQPKQRTPLSSPSLKVTITNAPDSHSARSPSRTSPSVRPKTSPTSRIPVRQRKASGLPKPPPRHIVSSHVSSSRLLNASSVERKTRVIHVSGETTPSSRSSANPPISSSAGPEASPSVNLNGGAAPVVRPIHSVIPARPSLKRKVEQAGSGDGTFGKDIGKDGEKQDNSGVMGFWSNLKLRPRGGSLSVLGSGSKKPTPPSPPVAIGESMPPTTSTKAEDEEPTVKSSSQRGLLRAPISRRTLSTSSAMSQKTLTAGEENHEAATPTAAKPKPIVIPSPPADPVRSPESPRMRSSSESSGSSCHSQATVNTQHSAASSATAPSTAPTSPIRSQSSLIHSSSKPLPSGSGSLPSRSILSRTPSTSSRKPTSSLSSKRTASSALSASKSVTFSDEPTVHYASEEDSGDELKETTEVDDQTDDVFIQSTPQKHPSDWPPVIEGRRGLKYPRGHWHELFADHSGTDLGNTSIREEDEEEEEMTAAPDNGRLLPDTPVTVKRLLSLSRKPQENSSRPSLTRNTSSSSTKTRPKGSRPSISGPFALGSLPLPSFNSPSASTPASFASTPISAPSSMLRYQQSSAANRSTTSLRSTLSVRSQSQSLRGSSTSTNPRRPHYKSASYSHPPRANGILTFLNADSPASSFISSASSSPSPSPFPAKGSSSRMQKSPYTISLRGAPSVESLKSTAGRSVRSLGSIKSTTSARRFRTWLNKVGEGIGITQPHPSIIDQDD